MYVCMYVCKSLIRKPKIDPSPRISARVARYILVKGFVDKNPRTTVVEIRNTLESDHNINVHSETVRSVLRKNGFRSRMPRKKSFMSENNRKK